VSGAILTFALPSAGTYEVRFFLNNSLTLLATSGPIIVEAPVTSSERDEPLVSATNRDRRPACTRRIPFSCVLLAGEGCVTTFMQSIM
jgi:hypothetical protein